MRREIFSSMIIRSHRGKIFFPFFFHSALTRKKNHTIVLCIFFPPRKMRVFFFIRFSFRAFENSVQALSSICTQSFLDLEMHLAPTFFQLSFVLETRYPPAGEFASRLSVFKSRRTTV